MGIGLNFLFFFGYQNTEVILTGHINAIQLLPGNCSIEVCQHGTFSTHNLLTDKTAFLAEWRYLKNNPTKRQDVAGWDALRHSWHNGICEEMQIWQVADRYFVYNSSELLAGTFLKIVITTRNLSQKVVSAVTILKWYVGCLYPFCYFQRTNDTGQDLWNNNYGLI